MGRRRDSTAHHAAGGSGRRQLIDGMAIDERRTTPQVSLVIEDRGSWIAAAQAGMGSFLSYRCVVAGHEGIEIRPFDPPRPSRSGSCIASVRSREPPRGSWI